MYLHTASDIRAWFSRRTKGRLLGRDEAEFVFTDHRQSNRLIKLATTLGSSGFVCGPVEYDGDGEAYVAVRPPSNLDESGLVSANSNLRGVAGTFGVEYLGVRIREQ